MGSALAVSLVQFISGKQRASKGEGGNMFFYVFMGPFKPCCLLLMLSSVFLDNTCAATTDFLSLPTFPSTSAIKKVEALL
jgi:hypothetical protein